MRAALVLTVFVVAVLALVFYFAFLWKPLRVEAPGADKEVPVESIFKGPPAGEKPFFRGPAKGGAPDVKGPSGPPPVN